MEDEENLFMPDELYFAMSDEGWFLITPKEFWDAHGHMYDQHIECEQLEHAGFYDLDECSWEYDGDPERGREVLLQLGLEENKDLL